MKWKPINRKFISLLPCQVSSHSLHSTSVYGLKLSVLRGTGGKALATNHRVVCFDSWGWQSFVSTCDVFNCMFPLDVQNEIQLLSRVFCYLWLVCLLGFCLRNASLVKVRNPISDGIVFVFHLAWCVRGFKSLKRFWPYLIAFRSCISNGKPE